MAQVLRRSKELYKIPYVCHHNEIISSRILLATTMPQLSLGEGDFSCQVDQDAEDLQACVSLSRYTIHTSAFRYSYQPDSIRPIGHCRSHGTHLYSLTGCHVIKCESRHIQAHAIVIPARKCTFYRNPASSAARTCTTANPRYCRGKRTCWKH